MIEIITEKSKIDQEKRRLIIPNKIKKGITIGKRIFLHIDQDDFVSIYFEEPKDNIDVEPVKIEKTKQGMHRFIIPKTLMETQSFFYGNEVKLILRKGVVKIKPFKKLIQDI